MQQDEKVQEAADILKKEFMEMIGVVPDLVALMKTTEHILRNNSKFRLI